MLWLLQILLEQMVVGQLRRILIIWSVEDEQGTLFQAADEFRDLPIAVLLSESHSSGCDER